MLLSPLAEGADQLVAEVALQPDIAAQLVAVLCWPPSLTLGIDLLARGGDVARFQNLLGRAGSCSSSSLAGKKSNVTFIAPREDSRARVRH